MTVSTGIIEHLLNSSSDFYSPRRQSFYAVGRWWVFVRQGGGFYTSTDGVTWSTITLLGTGAFTFVSVIFDGTYVHYVRGAAVTYGVYYRMGTPNADGTITWSATEQGIDTSASDTFPNICLDSNGYPWVTYHKYQDNDESARGVWVAKSTTKDGTWINESGFPYRCNTDGSVHYMSQPLNVLSGKICILYEYSGIYERVWSGTAMGDEVTLAYCTPTKWSSVADSLGKVHLIGGNGYYVRSTSGVWSSAQTAFTTYDSNSSPVIMLYGAIIYVFWIANGIIYAVGKHLGRWSNEVTLFDELEDMSTDWPGNMVGISDALTDYATLVYKTNVAGGGAQERYIKSLIADLPLPLSFQFNARGNLGIKQTRLHYVDDTNEDERFIEGTLVGASSGAKGNIGIKETGFHYIDASQNERYFVGTVASTATLAPGNIGIKQTRFHYADTSGTERYIKGTLV